MSVSYSAIRDIKLSTWITPASLAIFLIIISSYNFLLFHTLAELFAIIIAMLIIVVGWQMYPFTRNHFLMYLGCGYFWVAILDIFHTLTYEGLTILEVTGVNVGVQFWIGARYMESIVLLSAPWFLNHRLNRTLTFAVFGFASLIIFISIMNGFFPGGYIAGQGLTPFKIISEYIIIAILVSAIVIFVQQKHLPDKSISNSIIFSIILTICAELAFTNYISVYDFSNVLGHIFKFLSFWLIFTAIVRGTLQEPFDALYKSASTYDAIPDATIAVDQEGNILQANNSACRLADLPRDEIIGKKDHDIYHPSSIDTEECPICQAVRHNRVLNGLEMAANKEKTNIYSYSLSELRGISGGHTTVEVIRDITEKLQTETALQRAQKMDAIGKLTGGIAHDFNNMLGVILGFGELLKSHTNNNDPRQERYINEIITAGERAKKLTSKLLEFSRKAPSADETANINTLINGIRHMLEKTLTPRINLVFDCQEDLWPAWLDKTRLEDAILNVCINAMHAMPNGGTLTITTRNTHISSADARNIDASPGDYISLKLGDTGIGMDWETQQKIFDPFFTTKGEQGTGLGLSQVYGFVQQSNGAIQVDSEPGHGTQITMHFPRLLEQKNTTTIDGDYDSIAPSSGNETILVVDDEASLLELTREILSNYGYTVLCAESAEQALQMADEHPVDLLLSDVVLPGTDGYQLASNLKKLYPDIRIQMMSGYTDQFDSNLADEAWHEQRLHKPFTPELLLGRIRSLLDEK